MLNPQSTWRTAAQLAWQGLRHQRFATWVASSTLAAAVATIHVHLALTVRPADRVADLLDRFEQRYVLAFDGFATGIPTAPLDALAPQLQAAGVLQRTDVLCATFITEPDPLPLTVCSQWVDPNSAVRVSPELQALQTYSTGRAPRAGADEIAVEEHLAQRLKLQVGSRFHLYRNEPEQTVVGLFTRSAQVSTADVLTSLSTLQRLRQRSGEASVVLFELQAGHDVTAVVA